ncbi:MAG TPA: hypothetical protein VD994_07500 [Prosthecobacter sp.]|nr:hypothetical protein [Prosthecobacter sp.]
MATVIEDLIQGSRCTISEAGKTYRRVLKVEGLDRTPASNIHYRAIREAARAGAVYGAGHPRITDLVCNFIDTEPVHNSKTSIYVNVGYFDTSMVRIKLSGNVVRGTTRWNDKGEVLFTIYKPGMKPRELAEKNQEGSFMQPVEAPKLKPGMTLEYEWYDTKNTNNDAKSFTAAVNLRNWNGGKPRTWLCDYYAPEGVRVPGQRTIWHKRAGFTYQGFTPQGGLPETHNVMLWWRNPQTREVPPEIDPKAGGYPNQLSGNGWKEEKLNHAIDFNVLKLPNVVDA